MQGIRSVFEQLEKIAFWHSLPYSREPGQLLDEF
jgi:hypothetical protein